MCSFCQKMLSSNIRCFLKVAKFWRIFVKIELCAHCILDDRATKVVDLLPFFERSLDEDPAQKNWASLNEFILSKNAVIQRKFLFKSCQIFDEYLWKLNCAHTVYWKMKQQKLAICCRFFLASTSQTSRSEETDFIQSDLFVTKCCHPRVVAVWNFHKSRQNSWILNCAHTVYWTLKKEKVSICCHFLKGQWIKFLHRKNEFHEMRSFCQKFLSSNVRCFLKVAKILTINGEYWILCGK